MFGSMLLCISIFKWEATPLGRVREGEREGGRESSVFSEYTCPLSGHLTRPEFAFLCHDCPEMERAGGEGVASRMRRMNWKRRIKKPWNWGMSSLSSETLHGCWETIILI